MRRMAIFADGTRPPETKGKYVIHPSKMDELNEGNSWLITITIRPPEHIKRHRPMLVVEVARVAIVL